MKERDEKGKEGELDKNGRELKGRDKKGMGGELEKTGPEWKGLDEKGREGERNHHHIPYLRIFDR